MTQQIPIGLFRQKSDDFLHYFNNYNWNMETLMEPSQESLSSSSIWMDRSFKLEDIYCSFF